MSQVSDELLLAYLDGQLDTPQARSVERMISASDALRGRIEQLKTSQSYLIQTFETLARRTRASAQPQRRGHSAGQHAQAGKTQSSGPKDTGQKMDGAEPQKPRSQRSRAKMVVWAGALSVLAAIVGYGAGKWMRLNSTPAVEKIDERAPAPANRWADDIARLHSHFTTASVATDPESQTNQDLVELQLSRILNAPMKVPGFPDHALTFRRGQVLSYRRSRMMQLSYASAHSGLVALYIMPGGPDSGLSVVARRDITSVHWSAAGVRYVVAGKLPETGLRALAAVVMRQTKPK